MTKHHLKQRLCETIDNHRDEIIALGEEIWKQPELGFREVRTAKLAASPPRITKDEYLKYMANCTRTEIFGR